MRLCGSFCRLEELRRPEERPQPDRVPRERVGAPFLAIDDAYGVTADEARLADRLHRLEQGAARGDHVLDEADAVALLERPLEALPGAVALRGLADDQEGQPGLQG